MKTFLQTPNIWDALRNAIALAISTACADACNAATIGSITPHRVAAFLTSLSQARLPGR